MKKSMPVIFSFLLILMGPSVQAKGSDVIQIKQAFIQEMAPGQYSAAGYLRIKNRGSHSVAILRITSPKAGKVTIHRMIHQKGMMKMKAIKQLHILPHQVIALQPGDKHLMLQQVSHRLIHGEQVTLKFYFSDKSQLKVIFPVKKV